MTKSLLLHRSHFLLGNGASSVRIVPISELENIRRRSRDFASSPLASIASLLEGGSRDADGDAGQRSPSSDAPLPLPWTHEEPPQVNAEEAHALAVIIEVCPLIM